MITDYMLEGVIIDKHGVDPSDGTRIAILKKLYRILIQFLTKGYNINHLESCYNRSQQKVMLDTLKDLTNISIEPFHPKSSMEILNYICKVFEDNLLRYSKEIHEKLKKESLNAL